LWFRGLGQRKARYFWKFAAMDRSQRTGDRSQRTGDRSHTSDLRLPTSVFCILLFFLSLSSGCGNKFFDPTQVGRFRPVPAVNVILDSLGVAEEKPVAWDDAEEPLAIDTVAMESDYAFRAGDIISVAIFELLQEGIQFVNNYVVTETGRISIPEVGVVKAAGLTETQLEEEIKRILSPSILKNPSVIVALAGSQQRAFSILGDGVPLPGRYSIPRYDFRLTDALATAGGPRQFNVSYIYVSRFVGDERKRGYEPFKQGFEGLELEVIEPETTMTSRNIQPRRAAVRPRGEYQWPESKVVISSSEMVRDWEEAGIPKAFEWPSNRTPRRMDTQGTRKSSTMLAAPETTDEPVSVKDILKTLDERSHREREQRWLNGQVNVENALETFRELVRVEERADERINPRDTLASSPVPVAPKPISEPLDREEAGRIKWIFQNGKWISVADQTVSPKPTEEKEQTGHIEWIFRNGKWVPVQVGAPQPSKSIVPVRPDIKVEAGEKPFEQAPPDLEREPGAGARLIRIPADKLLAGDSRYNIVIKPGDTIHVPVDIIGEFCIMGNVNRTGYIPITGRPMTLKMAIAAAGGLGPLAWPRRCEVVRRIGRKKEEIVMVDLDKITSGEQPDFFIKPNDLINVGTHPTSRWRAILRNAFRATYGFGFVYDRNFADRDFYTSRPFPGWL